MTQVVVHLKQIFISTLCMTFQQVFIVPHNDMLGHDTLTYIHILANKEYTLLKYIILCLHGY